MSSSTTKFLKHTYSRHENEHWQKHLNLPEKAWKCEFPYTFVQGISQQKSRKSCHSRNIFMPVTVNIVCNNHPELISLLPDVTRKQSQPYHGQHGVQILILLSTFGIVLVSKYVRGTHQFRPCMNLKLALHEEWNRLPPRTMQCLVQGMRRRLEVVISAQGGYTRYWL